MIFKRKKNRLKKRISALVVLLFFPNSLLFRFQLKWKFQINCIFVVFGFPQVNVSKCCWPTTDDRHTAENHSKCFFVGFFSLNCPRLIYFRSVYMRECTPPITVRSCVFQCNFYSTCMSHHTSAFYLHILTFFLLQKNTNIITRCGKIGVNYEPVY